MIHKAWRTNLEEIVDLLEILLGGQAVEGVGDQSIVMKDEEQLIVSPMVVKVKWKADKTYRFMAKLSPNRFIIYNPSPRIPDQLFRMTEG